MRASFGRRVALEELLLRHWTSGGTALVDRRCPGFPSLAASEDRCSSHQAMTDRRLASNIRALYLLQGLSYFAPLAVIPFLARVLGSDAFGRYALALAISQYLAMITDYGFNLSATRDVAQVSNRRAQTSQIFWVTQGAKCILAVSATAIVAVAMLAAGSSFPIDATTLLAAAVAIPGSVAFPVWLFQGLQQMAVVVWTTAAARLSLMVLTFALVHGPEQEAIAVLLSAGTPLAAGVLCLTYMWQRQIVAWHPPTLSEIQRALRNGWDVFLSTTAISIYVTSVIPVLRALTDDATVGTYAAADRIIRAAHSLLTPISQAFFPHVNTVYAASPAEAIASLRRYARAVLAIGSAMSVALLAGAELAVILAFGPDFGASASVLRWLSPLPLVIGLSNVFGVQALLTMGYRKPFMKILIIAAAVYGILVIPLTVTWGVQGAAAAVLLTEIIVTLLMWNSLRVRQVHLFFGGNK